MICPKCNAENNNSARYCIKCGSMLEYIEGRLCPNCNTSNPIYARFCNNCASPLSIENRPYNREEYLRNEIERMIREKNQSIPKKKSGVKWTSILIAGILGIGLGLGGLFLTVNYFSSNATYHVIPKPDIRVTSFDTDISYNLSEGAIAIVDLVLTNYGNADGTVDLEFYNDKNQVISVQTFQVQANRTSNFRVKVDISISDKSLGVRIRDQRYS